MVHVTVCLVGKATAVISVSNMNIKGDVILSYHH